MTPSCLMAPFLLLMLPCPVLVNPALRKVHKTEGPPDSYQAGPGSRFTPTASTESRQTSTRKQQLAKQALEPDRQSSQQAPQQLGRSRRRGGSGALGAGATGHTQQAPPAHPSDDFLTSSSASRRLHAAPPSPSSTPSPAPPAPTTLLPRRNADGEVLLSIDGGPGSIAPERRAGLLWNLAAAAVSHLSQAWTRPVPTVEQGTNLTGTAGATGAGGLANGSVLPAAGRGAGARELGSKQPGGAVLVQEFGMVDAAPMVSGSQQAAPRPPDTASTIPSAPASLPTVAPGPDQPQSRDALTAMQPIVTRPVLKVQQLPPALWNLDRVDQVAPPLDHQYSYGAPGEVGIGQGVTIFGLDSGVIREHQEFQSWNGGSSRASYGFDFVDNDPDAHDCDGHGTHVGATALGRSVGVAKGASLVAVRVLDCTGSGSISDTVAGIDWVAAHARGPSVAIMSLGVAGGSWSATLESATRTLINTYNITVVVASGNSAIDACTVVPASLPESITVAASSMDNKFDPVRPAGTETMYRWSNTGSCVDIFAPGVEIWSACGGISRCPQVTPDAYTWASGTSMAVPHVAGLAAMYLGEYPRSTPAQVAAFIKDSSSAVKPHQRFPHAARHSKPHDLHPRQCAAGADDPAPGAGGRWQHQHQCALMTCKGLPNPVHPPGVTLQQLLW
ncbi:peptidase S8/S53 domain-containing protein [Haematococcus lacustris]